MTMYLEEAKRLATQLKSALPLLAKDERADLLADLTGDWCHCGAPAPCNCERDE